MNSRTPAFLPLFILTLIATWIVWGSSFVAIAVALDGLPPLLLMATRFVAAGALVTLLGAVIARRAGHERPSLRAWRDASLIGTCFIVIGMGATGWAATRLPTGIAALLVASAPLWIALLQAVFQRERGSSRAAYIGIALGVVGVALLVAPSGGGPSIDPLAALVLVAANAAWAGASLFAPRATVPKSLTLEVGMQMLTGGLLLLIVALASGEGARVSPSAIFTMPVVGSWLYLVVPAAIGGFLSYGWLLRNVSAGTASSHAFINPLVAVACGALLLGESISARMLVAGGAVVLAVVLLLVGEQRIAARAAAAVASGVTPAAARREVRAARARSRRAARALSIGRPMRTGAGWSPAPTPAFAARRGQRPRRVTDGMDALAIDEALESFN